MHGNLAQCCCACYDTTCAYCAAAAPNAVKLVWAGCTFSPIDDWQDSATSPGADRRWLQLSSGDWIFDVTNAIETHEDMHIGMLSNAASSCVWTKGWNTVLFRRYAVKDGNAVGSPLLEEYNTIIAKWTRLSATTARLAIYIDGSAKLYLFHGNATVTNDCRDEVTVSDDATAVIGSADPIDASGFRIGKGGTITVIPCLDDRANRWGNVPAVTPPVSLYMDSAEYASLDPACGPMVATTTEPAWAGEFRQLSSNQYESRDSASPLTSGVQCKVTIGASQYKMRVSLLGFASFDASSSWPPGWKLTWQDGSPSNINWSGKLSTGRWPEGVFHRINASYDSGANCSTLPASIEITDTP